jgi:hypothetical protein
MVCAYLYPLRKKPERVRLSENALAFFYIYILPLCCAHNRYLFCISREDIFVIALNRKDRALSLMGDIDYK